MTPLVRTLKYVGIGLLALVILVGAGVAVGVLGVPTVEQVENRFADVNDTATTIDTRLTVDNPNPVGASLGDLSIEYGIAMNDIAMANGSKDGLSVPTGSGTIPFRTKLANERIPQWWYTHVDGGERTEVAVDVDLSHSRLGGRSVSLEQDEEIQTDLLGQFNDSSTRPIEAGAPLVSDPVLYLNETTASYGANVTPARTPLDLSFRVYNPKAYPYAVSEVGYEIRMNGISVGGGSSERGYAILPRSTRTIRAATVVDNENLDDWWVSHLERDQVTNLTVDVYVIVDPDATGVLGESVAPIRIDSDALDYETTIETDIFGTKASDGLPPENATRAEGTDEEADDTGGEGETETSTESERTTATETATDSETQTEAATETLTEASTDTQTDTETATDSETQTEAATETLTEASTDTQTDTETAADDGILPVG